jgi:hypothetical protein
MADPLLWNAGEGYDIHVLRGGAASKSLSAAFNLPANANLATLRFDPGFDPAPGKFGVTVNATTGEVIASPPPTDTSRTDINNFLITASVQDNASKVYSTELRVYVHDAIDDIWLTPSSLTIRMDSDKTRFTVLAAFSDGVIGDITDWLLTYQSLVPGTNTPSADVLVGSLNGTLTAVNAGKTADVTVTVVLPSTTSSLATMTSAPARVTTKESWLSAAASTSPIYIVESLREKDPDPGNPRRPGTVMPNKADPDSAARNSVASVIANAANILFVSEGFSREDEFSEIVNRVVKELRTSDVFQPFKLLQDSINYWSVFIPSRDDGITLLGDYVAYVTGFASPLDESAKPASTATEWSVREMMHEVGMPVIADPATLSAMGPLWTSRYGEKNYTTLAAKNFNAWRQMARPPTSRVAVLNDHDTAFGMRNYDRPRAVRRTISTVVGSDPRRTPDADTFKFIENLTFGGRQIGSTWKANGKDKGRLCFICKTQKSSGSNWGGYFLSGNGGMTTVNVKSQPTGRGAPSFILDTPALQEADKLQLAMTVAHETGHSFKLGDEYGDGAGTSRDVDHPQGNLLPKKDITTTSGTPPRTVYDKTAQIKWLWPRANKAAMLNGKPQSTGTRFKVPLQKGHGKPFVSQDIVKFRVNPVAAAPTQDPLFNFSPFSLIVTAHSDDELELGLGHPGGLLVDLDSPNAPPDTRSWSARLDALFKPGVKVCLVCPVVTGSAGPALLVADAIRTHIASSNGPLNAPPGNTTGQETQVCKPNYSGVMTPTNLPTLTTKPAVLQDIIGIYEGGGMHDCGVFRPAGRCRMRQGDTNTIPFCHVCRYIIVDTLDPTQHGELDKLYPLVAP